MSKFRKSIIENRKKFAAVAFCVDIFLFAMCFMIAYYADRSNRAYELLEEVVSNGNTQVNIQTASLGMTMILCIPCCITTVCIMYFANMYRIAWQYAGVVELIKLLLVSIISMVLGGIYRGLFTYIFPNSTKDSVSLTIVIISYLLFFLFAILYRIFSKVVLGVNNSFRINNSQNANNQKVIVYGAGYNGAALVKRLIENASDGYTPVAFIDDDYNKKDTLISNIPVVGGKEMLTEAIVKYNAEVVVIAISTLTKNQLRDLFDYIKQFGLKIMITSEINDATNTLNGDVVSMRNIKIEDLLHRDEHEMDKNLVDSFIKDKVIMVTGGAGSIGSEICRQALIYGCKHLVIFDQHENGMFIINEELKRIYGIEKYSLEVGTVRDRDKLREVMERYHPNVVFHAAAYKHVPMMEISADESIKNNILGTKNVIEQCDESGVSKFVLISTDKAINPANIMGATKRVAELVLQTLSTKTKTQLAAVRFGNVLGSSGSVIPTFIKQINEGGPITVTDRDMKRYFMTIPEAVRLVLQAGALAKGGEVFVLDMGKPVYIYDLACDLVLMSGLVPNKDIEIKICGLRPGEKLFEELQYGDESVDNTSHKNIFACRLADVNGEKILDTVEKMKAVANSGDKDLSEKLLFDLVPSEYRNLHKNPNARV
ncbi:MAG: nucleoside-diphosphate sugar epimerase/dehydratase [Clostridia bacterium]